MAVFASPSDDDWDSSGVSLYKNRLGNQISFLRWLDNSVSTVATNFDIVHPLGKVMRWDTARKKKVCIDIAYVFQNYYKGMGGVNQVDRSFTQKVVVGVVYLHVRSSDC